MCPIRGNEMTVVNKFEKNGSFIDQLWNQAIQNIDDWDEGENFKRKFFCNLQNDWLKM